MDKEFIAEIIAQIRNKLQAPKTVLYMFSKGKDTPKKLIEAALEEIDKIVKLLKRLD